MSRSLARKLTWVVALKLAALTVLYFLFFTPAHRNPVDAAAHIAGPTQPALGQARPGPARLSQE